MYLEPSGSSEARARGVLCIVADGMGGYAAGEVASRIAVQGVRNRYYAGASTFIVEALRSAIEATNLEIWQTAQRETETRGMGCTMTAAVILGNDVVVGHVGDSRAYLVRDGGIAQITKDHSWVEEQVDLGALTRQQANLHPQRNVILRALGPSSTVAVDIVQHTLVDGDVILMCSDGLSTLVSDQELGRIAVDSSPDRTVKTLVTLANERGAPDNVTVAALQVHGPTRTGFSLIRPHQWWPLAAVGGVMIALALVIASTLIDQKSQTTDPEASASPTTVAGILPSPPGESELPSPSADPPATSAASTPGVPAGGSSATPASTLQPLAEGTFAHPVDEGARLHTSPDLNSNYVALARDQTVRILQVVVGQTPPDETDGNWYEVDVLGVDKRRGFLHSSTLLAGASATTPAGTAGANAGGNSRAPTPVVRPIQVAKPNT